MTLPRRYRFTRQMRISHQRDFQRVFEAKMTHRIGPLVIYSLPNGLQWPRLGLTVGKRVGTAVRRNRHKRLLREAFRLLQHDLPAGYDHVIVVNRHELLPLAEYQQMLLKAANVLHTRWMKHPDNQAMRESSTNPPDSRSVSDSSLAD